MTDRSSDTPERADFLVVLDVDSTLIENEAIELLAAEAGVLEHVAQVTERAMRGELDFAASLRERVATLAGLPDSVFDTVRPRLVVTDGVPALVEGVHAAGGVICVVSGGFHELLDPLAEELGLDDWRANRLEIHGGSLTGEVEGSIVDAATKAACLRSWAGRWGVLLDRTIAIGDGANDLDMMAAAGLGIAFDAKPAVRERADVVLLDRDLSLVLPILGLPRP
ncbi:phosphoserine phosphatase SerB [Labedella endophytica]|uniref:phosphoserine phosphatase n=1 Tax=Labedella endophytica TaxID=1523160 RepID=A0A433JQU9_9MICO|nr:phosphoserine phosphatase SerB [Labedella endophytica]RUR00656.1 phosphoserine phosphatase SerB [Labedella endophytica]